MSLLRFFEWLAETRWSVGIHESIWAFPITESIHVLSLCLFVGFAAMLDLRLLGWTLRRMPVSELYGRLMPWMQAGFALMVLSGLLTFLNTPVRYYENIFFRVKMALLLLAGLNVWLFHAGVYRRLATWDREAVIPTRARVTGALSLILWSGIIITGRMIAYNWFDKK